MAKKRKGRKSRTSPAKAPETAKGGLKARTNPRLTAQNRKLMGKHYAAKYRTGRG